MIEILPLLSLAIILICIIFVIVIYCIDWNKFCCVNTEETQHINNTNNIRVYNV